MSWENKIHAVFVSQPGEVSSRRFRTGGGPVTESADGCLHPVVARQCGAVVMPDVIKKVEIVDDLYRSGHDFPIDIAFGD